MTTFQIKTELHIKKQTTPVLLEMRNELEKELNKCYTTVNNYIMHYVCIELNKRNNLCDHCSEPNTEINSSYCCVGCEDAEIKFNELDN